MMKLFYLTTVCIMCVLNLQAPPIPWTSILKSLPFWAILLAHMGHNYGYETLMTELPTYMKQVLHFNLKDVSNYWLELCTFVLKFIYFYFRTVFCQLYRI